jgi:cyclopropane-fatty-acyl-phospholipid synthase
MMLLKHMIRDGSLRVVDGRGRIHEIGDHSPPVCTLRLHRPRLDFTLALNPALAVPEAYMDGELTVEDGTLYDLMDISARNYRYLESHPLVRLVRGLEPARFGQYNPIGKARKNVAHHYDLSGELYSLFLDPDRQYSCAYYTDEAPDLDSAQIAKKRHLAAKMLLRPGQRVLDIGCGWGGLGLYLAGVEDVDVTGVTLSVEQQALAQRRAGDAGLSQRAQYHLRDYRDETTVYDRIVSVGMFEHVGRRNYREFFTRVRDLLTDDGVMVLHSIGRFDTPAAINPFIRKYIFPGADLPSLSEVMRAIEPTGLFVTDIEILRLHYAETLRHWRERFVRNWGRARAIYDERFCRMWEMYLALCEVGFRHQNLMVFQMQITRRIDAVPLTRDYMIDWERRQAEVEQRGKRARPRRMA